MYISRYICIHIIEIHSLCPYTHTWKHKYIFPNEYTVPAFPIIVEDTYTVPAFLGRRCACVFLSHRFEWQPP